MKMPKLLAPLKKQVTGQDVLVGAAAGVAANVAYNYLVKKLLESMAPAATATQAQKDEWNNSATKAVFDKIESWGIGPVIAAILGGVGLYFAQKKSHRASGHLVGALSTGVALTARKMLAQSENKDLAALAAYQNYAALPAHSMHGFGIVQDDYSSRAALADLARVAADTSDDSALGIMLED